MTIQAQSTDYFGGSTRLDLMCADRSVSHVDGIVPLTLCFGSARVRADGIAGLGTEEDCRRQGYARQVMDAALAHMMHGDAGLSVLHGIRDFYHRFGYVSVGPIYVLSMGTAANAALMLPAGFHGRICTEQDLPALQLLYTANTGDSVGAAMRPPGGFVWAKLTASLAAGECRVVENVHNQVVAYAWRAWDCWAVRSFERGGEPNSFTIGEIMAADGPAADAVLAACRAWAEEEAALRSEPVSLIRFPQPPVGPVAAALTHHQAFSTQRYQPNGGFMARVIHLQRLLTALAPELARRLEASPLEFSGFLRLRTELGEASLPLNRRGAVKKKQEVNVEMSQAGLTRLIFGTTTPDDVLDREAVAREGPARQLLRVLFPAAWPHIYLSDQC